MRRTRTKVAGLAALAFAVTAGLGVWQLQRANQKLALERQQALLAVGEPVDEGALLAEPQGDWAQRPATLRGNWWPERQVWLDNRAHDRRAGTVLVTPLQLQGGAVIWVQRGWQVRAPGVHGVPQWPPTPAGEVRVTGRLAPQASQAYALGSVEAGPLRQNLNLSASAQELGRPVLPWVLWQTPPGCEPLRCDWPAPDAGVHKHWGYAAQWFALALLIVGLYVWFQHVQPRRTGARSGSTDGP